MRLVPLICKTRTTTKKNNNDAGTKRNAARMKTVPDVARETKRERERERGGKGK